MPPRLAQPMTSPPQSPFNRSAQVAVLLSATLAQMGCFLQQLRSGQASRRGAVRDVRYLDAPSRGSDLEPELRTAFSLLADCWTPGSPKPRRRAWQPTEELGKSLQVMRFREVQQGGRHSGSSRVSRRQTSALEGEATMAANEPSRLMIPNLEPCTAPRTATRTITSAELLHRGTELRIWHDGEAYQLRITRQRETDPDEVASPRPPRCVRPGLRANRRPKTFA